MTKRRENTAALNTLARWIERETHEETAPEGMSLVTAKKLADPDSVHFVQAIVLPEETDEPNTLYVGYNLDGRAVRVVQTRSEPNDFKYLPHLFFLNVTPRDFFGLRDMARKAGTLESSEG